MDYYNEFINYTSKFNYPECKFKVEHSKRVMDFAKSIAKSLNYSDEDEKLVSKASLLHDIGRFEQFNKYHTFIDNKSEYHGDIGVKVLINNDLISKFTSNPYEKKVILRVCKYHGTMDKLTNSKEDEIVKIVRDSDKIDILNSALNDNIKLDIADDDISENAIKAFKEKHLLSLGSKKTKADRFIVWVCFVFDFNFKYTFNYLMKTKLIDKLILKYINKTNNINTKKVLKEMGKEVNKYINEKI